MGRIFGIPFEIHYSWLFMFAIIVWSLAANYFPMHHPGVTGSANWVAAIITALAFFASVVVHEVAHSLVARAHGIEVDRIRLFALGGVSGLKSEATRPRAEFLVAVVGPLASLILAGVFWLVWRAAGSADLTITGVLFYLAYGNLALGLFNLIPGFPLDGGRVLRAIVWRLTGDFARATRIAMRAGRLVGAGLAGLGIYQVLFSAPANGFWLIVIGWYLWGAATEQPNVALIEPRLRGQLIRPLVRYDILFLAAADSVAKAAARIAGAPPQPLYPVIADGALIGAITPLDIARLPRDQGSLSVNWLARRGRALPVLPLDAQAADALWQLDALGVDALAVEDDTGSVVGLFERTAIRRLMRAASPA